MHHPRCAHPCVAFAKLLSLKGKILQASLLVISCNVFLFSSPTQLRCCVFLAEMVSPAWRPLTLLLWLPASSFSSWMRTWPPPCWPSQHLAKLPSQFCGLCICAAHGNGNWAELNEMMPWWIFSLMNVSASIGSQASTMNVQKHHCPSYTVYQMEHRFTFTFQTPISYRKYDFSPFNRLSIRMLFVVKLQISQVGHIRLLTVASNHPRRVFLLKLGFYHAFASPAGRSFSWL